MMATQIARHCVAIAGFVSDALTAKPIAGAAVVMTNTPAAFATRLGLIQKQMGKSKSERERKWNTMAERADKTRTREDGLFYFLDLPEGDYGLAISAPGYGSRYGSAQHTVKVLRTGEKKFVLDWALIALPPTAIKGSITSDKGNLSFAHVTVQGSGESALSGLDGQYIFTRVEPGQKTVLAVAQGYRPVVQTVRIGAPGDAPVLNFNMSLQDNDGATAERRTTSRGVATNRKERQQP